MNHRKERIGPLGIDGAQVAVADGAVGGDRLADRFGPLFGDFPDHHGVGGEACFAVVEDGGETAHQPRLFHPLRLSGQGRVVDSQRFHQLGERLGHRLDVSLQPLDHFVVDRFQLHRLLFRAFHPLLFGPVSLDVQLHRNFEHLFRREDDEALGARSLGQQLHRFFESQFRIGRHGDREPEIVGVVPFVVVADTGVLVDDLRRPFDVGHLECDQGRLVSQGLRIEDGRCLANHLLLFQSPVKVQQLLFAASQLFGQLGERSLRDRETLLNPRQKLFFHRSSVPFFGPIIKVCSLTFP